MSSDTRSLAFDSTDDAQRWRVFRAVEEVAADVAAQQGLKTQVSVSVRHTSGDYTRSTVTEAKAVTDRNGYVPVEIQFEVYRLNTDAWDAPYPWVSAHLYNGANRLLKVAVEGRNELEVNGAFTLIENAVNQAKKRPAKTRAVHGDDGSLAPKSRWSRLLNHPYSVQIIGGASATFVAAAVTAIWAILR